VPDFVEGGLASLALRRLVAGVARVISGLYVVPQLIVSAHTKPGADQATSLLVLARIHHADD
jgi:hypothetical protein